MCGPLPVWWEGTNDPNREGRGDRTAPKVDGGRRRVTAASAQGAESARVCRDAFVPLRCRGGHKQAGWRGGGITMMASAVAMERVVSDLEMAR
jgi:hypothetical protein